MKPLLFLCAAGLAAASAGTARASEIFGGVYAHDVMIGLTKSGIEEGVDLHLGWRGDRIASLGAIGGPSPYLFVSANTAGDTNFAAAGLSWRIGQELYIRPGIGLAVHDGPTRTAPGSDRIDFGSRILFEPELAVGYQLSDRLSAEASWVHLSHGQLFSGNNPGLDTFGIRLNYRMR